MHSMVSKEWYFSPGSNLRLEIKLEVRLISPKIKKQL